MTIRLLLADDGAGTGSGQPGTGLIGLTERATAVGASLRTRRLSPQGFELSVLAADGLDQNRTPRPDKVDA